MRRYNYPLLPPAMAERSGKAHQDAGCEVLARMIFPGMVCTCVRAIRAERGCPHRVRVARTQHKQTQKR
jgi:hypothetical protein